MPSVRIQPSAASLGKVFRSYHAWHLRKLWQAYGGLGIPLVLAGIVVIGISLHIMTMAVLGAIALALFACWLGWAMLRATLRIRRIRNLSLKDNTAFTFYFDGRGFGYLNSNHDRRYPWEAVVHHVQHRNHLYLFDVRQQLLDIISSDLMGDEYFDEFQRQLQQLAKA